MEYWVRFPAAPLIFTIVLGKLETFWRIAMARYRITQKPSSSFLERIEYDVEELLPMAAKGLGEPDIFFAPKPVEYEYWSFLEGPFTAFDDAAHYVEATMLLGHTRTVKEYD
jgi:hypothetical protein